MEGENQTAQEPEKTGKGYLVVHVTTASGAIPVEGAQVDVRNYTPEFTEGRGDVIASLVSGRDGNTVVLPLSAPPRENALSPDGGEPFTRYNIEVTQENYYRESYTGVPIFDGITAIQPVEMIPLPEDGTPDIPPVDDQRFAETTETEL